ncbi:phosphoenolpyruvate--protein phosphotransferase [Aquicella lusitana]|uniref:phosphoenolpyruvate--protein phosphotransferase n=1 Tax=Aquicella lusitana TaxID=254246 RepID=A0A370GYL2_9COXI|nr:phosphoenolpyruvate--protein phosphotransferase [Aquicella lusitana]RDI48589.1 PTSINtr with GAF domain PtsP [Aquicella lusitana]VVC74034.1 Phosphoenolpyruvate-protein phosphotransferase [Aquicella lusitana]
MLTILRHIIQEVTSAQDFREALDIMVKRIANALATQACSIFLLDRHHGEYVLVATQGLNPQAVGKVRVPINKGLIGLVGEREEPLNIDDATKHPRFYRVPEIKEEAYRAFLGTPVIYHRQVLGVLIVQQEDPRRYDESEEAFLVTLATQLAAIIAHAEATGALAELLQSSKEKRHELIYSGVPGAPGIGMGVGVVVYAPYDLDTIPDREPDSVEAEIQLLEAAFSAVREDLRLLSERLYPALPPEERALFDVYQRILDSADMGKEVADAIRAGNWAPGALREVIQAHVRRLESLDNEYMRERAEDIKDLGQRVLTYLQKNDRTTPQYAEKTILIGESITPTDLAEVPEGYLAGVISAKGSGNSHVAILARAMRVPTVMGVGDTPIYELQDKEIIVDGYYGQIYVSPSPNLRTEFERLIQEEKKLDAALEEIRDLPAVTKDGQRIGLLVNTGLGADISISLAAGAEGVGLYRTEIPFLMRDRFPSGEEQRIIYRQLLASFAPRPVIIRTLDVGGDKPLPYFPIKEDNPFLGWRGIRITLDHPEIFLSQVRAMMRASEGLNNMRIMLPMITDATEVDEALRLLRKAYTEVRDEGYDVEMPQIGVMIEVPSAVYQARVLAKRVDFLSVGSNDLTQYILAVDRNNPRVANLYDALHPAVLRALIQVVENGHQEGKHVSICGEVAGDPVAVLLLLAMGFDSLSMNASSIGRVKWVIRHFTHKKAAKLLHEVLGMENAVMIRCHMELALERAGLGNLIRAGR